MDFAGFVTDLASGQVNQRLGEQVSALVEAVQDVHQKGTLTVTFTIQEEGRQIKVDVKAKIDSPVHPLHGSLFFPVEGQPGELTREDQRQGQLRLAVDRGLRNAVEPRGEVVDENGEVIRG